MIGKCRPLPILFAIPLSVLLLLGITQPIFSGEERKLEPQEPALFLSLADVFKDTERPPVKFHHQIHAEALKAKGCTACHPADKAGILVYTYPQPADAKDKESWMRAYHDACIGCHQETIGERKESGPVTCGECHVWENQQEAQKPLTWWPDGGFDYYLHSAHVAATDSDCGSCHHTGDLSSCRDCHAETATEEAASFRSAAHASCIACHLDYDVSSSCTDCHREKKRTAEEMAASSRPQIGQPEATCIASEEATLPGVPFHHAAHEGLTETCRACHHQTMKPCDSCHTPKGSPDGGGVPLAASYHEASSLRSCVGCHNAQKSERACAGCHHTMPSGLREASCLVCHSGSFPEDFEPRILEGPLSLLPDALPEVIEISLLEKDYQPAQFPHSAHIQKLTAISNNDALARYFHANPLTICRGCHHYSPVEKKSPVPPCITCHTPKPEPKGNTPTLASAYHRQCQGCHKQMGTQPTDCTGCHLEKASP